MGEQCKNGLKQFCLALMRSKRLSQKLHKRVDENWDAILDPVVPIIEEVVTDEDFQIELYRIIDQVLEAIPEKCWRSTLNPLVGLDPELGFFERTFLGFGCFPEKVKKTIRGKLKEFLNIQDLQLDFNPSSD